MVGAASGEPSKTAARGLEGNEGTVLHWQRDRLGDFIGSLPSPASAGYTSMGKITPTGCECKSKGGLCKWKRRTMNFTAEESKSRK